MKTALHHLLAHSAIAHGARPALSDGGITLNYAELWDDTAAVGNGLVALGVGKGDRVAIYLEKRSETVSAIFGASVAGAVMVPINPVLRPRQVAFIAANSGAKVLVTSETRFSQIRNELENVPSLEHVVLVEATHDQEVWRHPAQLHHWEHVFAQPHGSIFLPPIIDFDLAAILYTSGSTGSPKGVVLSHRNLIAGAQSVSSYLGNSPDDVILSLLPLSFDAGLSQLTTAFASGAHVVLHNYLLAAEVPRICARNGVTGITGVPPLWLQLAEESWDAEAALKMRYFANTGGRMPRTLLNRLRLKFPKATPYLMYGLTEAFRSTYLDPAEVDRRPDSIGKAIPDAEILVVRPDGSECGPDEEGELVHRGALVAQGYWGDPARTAERFRPVPGRDMAWRTPEYAVFSGDIVTRDADGFLYYVGRRDEMIKTSGYRVSPTEIEEVAYETGKVADAVALGVEDPKLGQRVVLIVTKANGKPLDSSDLLSAMKRQLPLYMVPREVIVRDSIPRSANGKFDRVLLRQELAP